MMRLMGAMEIFTAQQQEDIKDEVRLELENLIPKSSSVRSQK